MESKYNSIIEVSNCIESAAIGVLEKYLRYNLCKYEIRDDKYLLYNSYDLDKEKYLDFIEYYYCNELSHKLIEYELIHDKEYNNYEVEKINAIIDKDSVLRNILNGITFNGKNSEFILNKIKENRYEIIEKCYRNKVNLYLNYFNNRRISNKKQ